MRICIYEGGRSFKDMMKFEDGGECFIDIACKDEIRDALMRVVKRIDSIEIKEEPPEN